MLRHVGGFVTGAATSVIVILAMELLGHAIYPPPPGIDWDDNEQVAKAIEKAPTEALVLVIVAWGLGTVAGSFVASTIGSSGEVFHGFAMAVLMLVGGITMMLSVPHPAWMWLTGCAVFVPAGLLGAHLAPRKRDEEAAALSPQELS